MINDYSQVKGVNNEEEPTACGPVCYQPLSDVITRKSISEDSPGIWWTGRGSYLHAADRRVSLTLDIRERSVEWRKRCKIWNKPAGSGTINQNEALKRFRQARSKFYTFVHYRIDNGAVLILVVYVDDLLINNINDNLVSRIVIGSKVYDKYLWLNPLEFNHQYHYVQQLLELFGMEDCVPAVTPTNSKWMLKKKMSPSTLAAHKNEFNCRTYRSVSW